MRIIKHALQVSKIFYIIIVLSCFIVDSLAQTKEDIERLEEIRKKRAEIYRTINQNEELKKLSQEYNAILARSESYGAFTFGWDIGKANISSLNKDASSSGLPSMNDKFQSIVFGYSRMNKRLTGDFLIYISLPNKTENGTHEITLSGAGASWDKGYAIISNSKILFFPFAGIGWQSYTVRVSQKNNALVANDLLDVAQGSRSGSIYQGSLYGSLGAQLNLAWANKKRKELGWHTGLRFSYNPALVKGKFRYSDGATNYKPGIKWREFQVSILFDLFTRIYLTRNLSRMSSIE